MIALRGSEVYRVRMCRGCLQAAKGLNAAESAAAASGDRIHRVLAAAFLKWGQANALEDALGSVGELTERDESVARWFYDQSVVVIESCGSVEAISVEHPVVLQIDEVRLTGTPDLVVLCDGRQRGLIFDWKTGQADLGTAADNDQLAHYAGIIGTLHGLADVTCFLFSAGNKPGTKFTGVSYTPSAYRAAVDLHVKLAREAHAPDAKRTVGNGDHCVFCPAFGVPGRCDESVSRIFSVADWAGKKMKERVLPDEITPDQAAAICDLWDCLTWCAKAKDNLKNYLTGRLINKGEDAVPGFTLSKPGRLPVIRSAKLAEKVLVPAYIPTEKWQEILTVRLPDVVRLVKEKADELGVPKTKIRAYVEDRLKENGLLQEQFRKRYVRRTNEEDEDA